MSNQSLYNGQNLTFTGGPYSNPYALIQKAGKRLARNKSRRTRNGRTRNRSTRNRRNKKTMKMRKNRK
jgi:hypothetical protein